MTNEAARFTTEFSPVSAPAPLTGFVSRPLPAPRAHALTFVGLWLFTALLIFRPGDAFPALARAPIAVAALTLGAFCLSQLWTEGRASAWPREVVLVGALCVCAALSIPWSIDRSTSMETFLDRFMVPVLMFVVMVNAVRTQKRLLGLFALVLAAGAIVSVGALQAFRRGEFSAEGYRVGGTLGASLADPNDTALFLVTMIPVAVALLLSVATRFAKVALGVLALLMTAAVVVTYSRGGFLALACAGAFFGFKLFRRAPVPTASFAMFALFAIVVLLPGNYANRLASIVDPDLDPHATVSVRRDLLDRSVQVALENPLVGLGMGNFWRRSIGNEVSHNAYTQVASEMGLAATGVYVAFLLAPLARLRRVERETERASYDHAAYKRVHFLAIGLQASLIGFLVGSFFLSVAYYWFLYYLVGYAVCLSRVYETEPGRIIGTFRASAQEAGA